MLMLSPIRGKLTLTDLLDDLSYWASDGDGCFQCIDLHPSIPKLSMIKKFRVPLKFEFKDVFVSGSSGCAAIRDHC